jgi:hypothetical protein
MDAPASWSTLPKIPNARKYYSIIIQVICLLVSLGSYCTVRTGYVLIGSWILPVDRYAEQGWMKDDE